MSVRSDVLQQIEYPAVIQAMENNLIEFIMYCSCIPDAQAYRSFDHIAAITGIPQPSLNVVMRTLMDEATILTRIEEIMVPFKARKVPMLWWIFPGTQPQNIGEYLTQCGIQSNGIEPGMVLDLSWLPADKSNPPGFSIEEVTSDEDLQEWITVSARAFGGDTPSIDPDYITFERCLGWGKELPYRRFLGRLNGKPVATSSIFLGTDVVGLYSVGTLPEARRQGIGSMMSIVPLSVGRALGYNVSVLQSSPAGYNLYHAIGFRECCRIQLYLWAPEE
ncbi:hypothetical protein KDA_61860 [Dictyobacter alpinus]|uniref:N-acetyltransferase domain-containing protein n=1 Tax=Dictyobacter alpinus TaxID=2014873 RepID=A0A402BHI5_9CHLR|nr:GNAT family N-acetyltransferase [Dictyobacter alpinus]GCE30702.1 hypothetical protein KDA_61860 [Dictyobacter alpinus]